MKRIVPAALVAALLCAPAGASIRGYQFAPVYRPDAPKVAEPLVGSYEGVHTVAVCSAIGGRFDLELRSGATKRIGGLDITGWRIDERAEAVVRHTLKERFRFAAMPCDRLRLAGLPPGAAHQNAFETFANGLRAEGVDAFILVRPNAAGGLALQTVTHKRTVLWVDFTIDLVEARSHRVIAEATARVQAPGTAPVNFPGLLVGDEFALDPSLQLNADEQDKLHRLTDELLTVTLTDTLVTLKLVKP